MIAILKDLQEWEGKRSLYLFASPNGGSQDPDSVLQIFKRILNRCKLNIMSYNDICRSHIAALIEMNIAPKLLQDRLGHEKIQTTLDTYGHLYPDRQAEVARQFEAFMSSD